MSDDSVYHRLRSGIVSGTIAAGERLVAADLAARFGSSTNPVREALQQLRGEGLVEILPNRGARVRRLGIDFVRDVHEIQELLEPYLTRGFVRVATARDIADLESIQADIESLGFDDTEGQHLLDTRFHQICYDAHYNRNAVQLWLRHRSMLDAIAHRFAISQRRRAERIAEHGALIAAVRAGDEDAAAAIIAAHVRGAGAHVIEHLTRAERLGHAGHPAG